jgi:hypothetical protein
MTEDGWREAIKTAYEAGLNATFFERRDTPWSSHAKIDAAYRAGVADRNRELLSELLLGFGPRRRGPPEWVWRDD